MEPFLSALKKAPNHYRLHLRHVTDAGEQLHYHDCYQILYVLEGNMVHGKSDHQVLLGAGEAFLVPPGYVHQTRRSGSSALTYYSLSFRETMFSPGFAVTPLSDFLAGLKNNVLSEEKEDVRLRVCLSEQDRKQVERLLAALSEEYDAAWNENQTMAGHLVAAILRVLIRSYTTQTSPEKEDPVQACIRYLDGHYRTDVTVDDLAKQFALSRSALIQQFTRRTGVPIKRYLHQKRIEQAQKLCALPEISIREVAYLVGYQEFSTFYRNFKKLTGQSPAEYRALRMKTVGIHDKL